MKNIHLIPTDKPSRLYISDIDKVLELDDKSIISEDYWIKNQNVYITSDEEIKIGDKSLLILDGFDPFIMTHHEIVEDGYLGKKIILSTDQDLISDGIQSIDDEFLEWFCSQNVKIIEPSTRLKNSLKQFNLSLEESINLNPIELKKIGFGNRSIIELKNMEKG